MHQPRQQFTDIKEAYENLFDKAYENLSDLKIYT